MYITMCLYTIIIAWHYCQPFKFFTQITIILEQLLPPSLAVEMILYLASMLSDHSPDSTSFLTL